MTLPTDPTHEAYIKYLDSFRYYMTFADYDKLMLHQIRQCRVMVNSFITLAKQQVEQLDNMEQNLLCHERLYVNPKNFCCNVMSLVDEEEDGGVPPPPPTPNVEQGFCVDIGSNGQYEWRSQPASPVLPPRNAITKSCVISSPRTKAQQQQQQK